MSPKTRYHKFHNAKIGTIPSPGVWMYGEPVIGKRMKFREYGSKKWQDGIVTSINDHGYLFIDLM